MIVRESLSPRKPPSKAAWPPRSPHDALASSPSAKRRLQHLRDVSPSPVKRRRVSEQVAENPDLGSDDDEETLQLKLQQIQAQLKLKKLQQLRKPVSAGKENGPASPSKVEVPHSPKTQRVTETKPESPRRVQLGIDRGLRAANVSLKRARPDSQPSNEQARAANHGPTAKRMTFSERLLQERTQDHQRVEKRDRLEKTRSHGFGVTSSSKAVRHVQRGLDTRQSESQTRQPPSHATQSSSTKEKAGSHQRPNSGSTSRASQPKPPSPDIEQPPDPTLTDSYDPFSTFHLCTRHLSHSTLDTAFENKAVYTIPRLLKEVTAPHYDPPDTDADIVIHGIIASKSHPHAHAPKHAITTTGDADAETPKSKFMVLKLTDLRWEVDLFLFDSAFDRFWKLTPGTVIAVLNPAIMAPRPHMRDTGQFSLKLASSEDTVLEVGVARDLGWCGSVKRDGKVCAQWVDRRRTEYCEFHVNLGVERARAGRMEVNGMVGLGFMSGAEKRGGRGGSKGQGRGRGGRWPGGGGRGKDGGLRKEGAQFNQSLGETSYTIPKEYSSGRNTAKLLDSEDYVHGGLSKAERSQKRLAASEKEQGLAKALGSEGSGLAKALGSEGSGLGGEYMRKKRLDDAKEGEDAGEDEGVEKPKSAADLGLAGRGAGDVHLSPSKQRVRRDGSRMEEPMGWGGAYKRGLLSPSGKDRSEDPASSAAKSKANGVSPRKKARFMLEKKGIRMPGRESLANGKPNPAADDDELDIV